MKEEIAKTIVSEFFSNLGCRYKAEKRYFVFDVAREIGRAIAENMPKQKEKTYLPVGYNVREDPEEARGQLREYCNIRASDAVSGSLILKRFDHLMSSGCPASVAFEKTLEYQDRWL